MEEDYAVEADIFTADAKVVHEDAAPVTGDGAELDAYSVSTCASSASSLSHGSQWGQKRVVTYVRLGAIELLATYFYCLFVTGVIVASAMGRKQSPQAPPTRTRTISIVLCSALAYSVIHWGFNVFASAQHRETPSQVKNDELKGEKVFYTSPLTHILASAPLAHMNPVVTIALLVATRMNYVLAIIFLPIQLIAAILAVGTIWLTTPQPFLPHIAGIPASPDSAWWQDFSCEIVSTLVAFIPSVAYAATRALVHPDSLDGFRAAASNLWELSVTEGDTAVLLQGDETESDSMLQRRRNKNAHYEDKIVKEILSSEEVAAPIGAIFAAFFVASFITASVSGGFMNPALSFAMSLMGNRWKMHWLRWAAPVAGAVILGFAIEGALSICGRKRHKRKWKRHRTPPRSDASFQSYSGQGKDGIERFVNN